MFHEPSEAHAWRAVGTIFTSKYSSTGVTVGSPPPVFTALLTVIQRDMKSVALESINKRMPSHVTPACTYALAGNCRSSKHTQRHVSGNSFSLARDMSRSSHRFQTSNVWYQGSSHSRTKKSSDGQWTLRCREPRKYKEHEQSILWQFASNAHLHQIYGAVSTLQTGSNPALHVSIWQ